MRANCTSSSCVRCECAFSAVSQLSCLDPALPTLSHTRTPAAHTTTTRVVVAAHNRINISGTPASSSSSSSSSAWLRRSSFHKVTQSSAAAATATTHICAYCLCASDKRWRLALKLKLKLAMKLKGTCTPNAARACAHPRKPSISFAHAICSSTHAFVVRAGTASMCLCFAYYTHPAFSASGGDVENNGGGDDDADYTRGRVSCVVCW